jgi:cysteinyl-tRNA synthetase
MSKSLGNFFTLRDLLSKGWTGREIRYVLINGHYRQALNFTFDALDAARASLARVDECVRSLTEAAGAALPSEKPAWVEACLNAFSDAVNDDLKIPETLAALFSLVRESNSALRQPSMTPPLAAAALHAFDEMDRVLGVVRFGGAPSFHEIPTDVADHGQARAAARAGKDWAEADRLRKALADMGWEVRDAKDGQKVKRL